MQSTAQISREIVSAAAILQSEAIRHRRILIAQAATLNTTELPQKDQEIDRFLRSELLCIERLGALADYTKFDITVTTEDAFRLFCVDYSMPDGASVTTLKPDWRRIKPSALTAEIARRETEMKASRTAFLDRLDAVATGSTTYIRAAVMSVYPFSDVRFEDGSTTADVSAQFRLKVIVSDAGRAVPEEVLSAVRAEIEKVRPVGVIVSVEAAKTV